MVKFVTLALVGIVNCCQVRSSLAIVEKQACRSKGTAVWTQFQLVHKIVAKLLLVACTIVVRCAILGIAHHVWFMSLKSVAVVQHLELWNAIKQRGMRSSHAKNLVGGRRIVADTGVVNGVALFPTLTTLSLEIGIHTFAKCPVGRS